MEQTSIESAKELEPGGEFLVLNSASSYPDYQRHINRYAFASNFVKNKTVLDIACGSGYGSNYLKRKGAKTVIGGDISEEAVKYGKIHYREEALDFMHMDATNLPFSDESFGMVVSFETIEHIKEYKKFLCECHRVLKLGGTFVCSTPNRQRLAYLFYGKPPLSTPFHVEEFSTKELKLLLEDCFADTRLYYQPITLSGFIFPLGGRLLSLMPKGKQVKEFVKGALHHDIPYRGQLEVTDEELDRKYKVIPLKKGLSWVPHTIIAVARKKD